MGDWGTFEMIASRAASWICLCGGLDHDGRPCLGLAWMGTFFVQIWKGRDKGHCSLHMSRASVSTRPPRIRISLLFGNNHKLTPIAYSDRI